MASIQRLHLEDCLEDTPQAKAMLDLFEKDTLMLKKFTRAFASSCQKMANAQSMMISATQELSYYLRMYGKQDFPLGTSDQTEESSSFQKQNQLNDQEEKDETKKKSLGEETLDNNEVTLAFTLNQFANYVDEISTCFQVFVTQLNDSMIYPLNKLMDNEFEELNSLQQMYQISSEEEEFAIQRYLRLPTKKENDLQRKQFSEEVYVAKKKFHQISMNYYSSLNTLQHKRQYMLIEPMLSCIHNFKLFFKMGSETFDSSPNIDEFVNKTSLKICDVKSKMAEDISKTNQMIDLLQQDDSIYYIDQPVSDKVNNNVTISDTVFQKSGYLNLKSKIPFISKWDRAFYFIQNGFLMCMQKNEIAGYSFIEIKSDLTISICNIDDRPFTFQINSQFPKRKNVSKFFIKKWIKILQNAVKEENRAKLLNYKNTQAFTDKPQVSFDDATKQNIEKNIKFELKQAIRTSKAPRKSLSKPQQGESFRVRFLGSMNVKADKGNEYINETIRQVMGSRAAHNIFKLSEFTLVINSESISLFKIPPDAQPMTEDLIVAKFEINELAFWCTHKDNERLFGFIIKEPDNSLKFICHVFESDANSSLICDALTQATQLAYQLLIQENRSEHFMKMKNREREILLQNIKSLPDKNGQASKGGENESDEENKLLQNAASVAFNSPNPNFVVLDQETLDTYDIKHQTGTEEEEITNQPKEVDQVNRTTDSCEKSESEA